MRCLLPHLALLLILSASWLPGGEPLVEALEESSSATLSLNSVFEGPAEPPPPPVAPDEPESPADPPVDSLTAPTNEAASDPPIVESPVAIDSEPTTKSLTLRSLLAEPVPTPAAELPRERETRLSVPLDWATADPDNRVPFRAPPAQWLRAPREVLDERIAKVGRPDPMLELIRLHGGKLPRLSPRGFSEADQAPAIRKATAPFLRIVNQESSQGSPPVRLMIVNASREMPARIVIEPLAPPSPDASVVAAPPAPPLVMLLPPGASERLSVLPGLYRFQRFVWSSRDVTEGRARSLLAETFGEQELRAGASYEGVLSPEDERKLRRALEN